MSNDSMGDRLKEIEMTEAGRKALRGLPVLARLDGNGFSRFTKGLGRPYDKRLSDLMIETTAFLVEETAASCGYTQSDEITLSWYSSDYKSQIWFDGRFQKMASILSAKCSVFFNKNMAKYIPEKSTKSPVFDCRVWQSPTLEEGVNFYLWRELDATKNAISMAARCYFSHKELQDKTGAEMQEMMFQKFGINFNDYPSFFRRGTYLQRKTKEINFTPEEILNLPPKHEAKINPELKIKRTEIVNLELPILRKIKNKINVLFFGEDFIAEKDDLG